MVPIILFFVYSKSLHWSIWPSVLFCLIGVYLLSDFSNATVRLGDGLVILCALFWSLHIIFIGIFMELLTGMGTAFGLGMYLPMVVTLPMVVGGALRDYWEARFLDVSVKKEGLSEKQRTMRLLNTYMIATGCIVGEALLGTFLAIYYVLPLVMG